jgi:membrane-associated phospholipid phosphatase
MLLAAHCARADVVNTWNNALLDSIRTENTHPCAAARALAIVHGAMFDVSATIAHQKPFHAIERAPGAVDLIAALHAAAYTVSTNLFPSRVAAFTALYKAALGEISVTPERAPSLRFGSAIADSWIEWRGRDTSSGSRIYIPNKEPGAWRRTPPFFRPPEMQHWAGVAPFILTTAAQFRPVGPPNLTSKEYAQDLNAVLRLGAAHSPDRSSEQTEIAKFWSDFSYTVTPPGHWNQIAQVVARARSLTIREQVHLFAILNLAMNDVAVACWDAKYAFNFWRPVTAIRAAADDQNPETIPDSKWMPLLNTPAFPEYISGHSAFSGAASVILAHFNGSDRISFSVPSDSLPGNTRNFESLQACAEEISQSRLYGGIHFPSALNDGLKLGRTVAAFVLTAPAATTENSVR